MAGFFSPSLGFSSTIGAAIKGAAQEGSALLNQQHNEERQNEIMQDEIWANKYDNFLNKRQQLKRNLQQESDVYNQALQLSKGDTNIANMAIVRYRANPKDLTNILNDAQNIASKPGFTPNTGASPFAGQQAETLQNFNQVGQNIYNRLGPKLQGQYGPFDTGQTDQQGNYTASIIAPPQVQQQPASAQTTTIPTGPTTTVGLPPVVGHTNEGQPIARMPDGTTRPLSAEEYNAYATGATSLPGQTPTQPTQDQVAQAGPNQPYQFTSGKGASTALTPYQQLRIQQENRSMDIRQRAADVAAETAKGTQAKNQAVLATTISKPNVTYFDDPKVGLQARYQTLRNLQAQNWDTNSMMDILNRGLKASATQPAFDELNRLTTSVLGLDLSTVGTANPVGDVTMLQKDRANAILNRLSTFHFGRILQTEVELTKQGITNTNTTPSTNVKITLMLKAMGEQMYKATSSAYNTAFGPGASKLSWDDRADRARQTEMNVDKDYANMNLPWTQVDTSSPKSVDEVKNIPKGSWFEDRRTGMMYLMQSNGVPIKAEQLAGQQ